MSSLEDEIYTELHSIASKLMRRERRQHTLQPTALAHEAYLKLGERQELSRSDFLARAARAMRRILVDYARRRNAQRRGGGVIHEVLVDVGGPAGTPQIELIALDTAMQELEQLSPRRARILELLFFAGLTIREAAEVLNVSTTTVEDDWHFARAWLRQRLDS